MSKKWLAYAMAILLWLLCLYEIGMLLLRGVQGRLGETPLVGGLFSDADDSFVPIAVFSVLGWILVEVLLHAVRVWREYSAVQQIKGLSPERFRSAKVSEKLRAGRRVQLVRDHLGSSPQYLHDALPAASAIDASALENAYSLTKTYVWILPVLGFIGTAWGMSHAIGGFSDALGETRDVGVLADRLGQRVIPGLSNAFSVTMLALSAAIVSHFWVMTIQSADQEALEGLDDASVKLLARVPNAHPAAGPAGAAPPELVQILRAIVDQLNHIRGKLELNDVATRLDIAAGQLVEAANETRTAATEVGSAAHTLKNSVRLPYHISITRGESDEEFMASSVRR